MPRPVILQRPWRASGGQPACSLGLEQPYDEALEHEALKEARTMLSAHAGGNKARWRRAVRDYPLGPSLGQCCGGYVRLLFEVVSAPEMAEISDTLADVSEVEKVLAVRPLKYGLPMRF